MTRNRPTMRTHRPRQTGRHTRVAVPGRALSIAALIVLLAAVPPGAACADDPAGAASELSFAERFAQADPASGAMFRWWWPGAAVEPDVLRSQLEAVARAGYKGVEIADVKVGVEYPVDPDRYQYGSPAWRSALDAATGVAERLNLQVDITMGPHWPVAVPGLDVNGPASSKELIGAFVVLDGPAYSGPVPLPEPLSYPIRDSIDGRIVERHAVSAPTLVAASALRCRTRCSDGSPELDLTSFVDLTEIVTDGSLDWQAPDGGSWVVLAHWQRGTGQRNDAPWGTTPYLVTNPESRVVDHFSLEGAQAFLEFFETTISDETISGIARVGGALFEDSIELKASQLWTADMPAEFGTRRGYALEPYLACATYHPADGPFDEPKPVFGFSERGSDTCARVRRDLAQTLADLYVDHHLVPFKRWANDRGIGFRAQPYGIPIDMAKAAAMLDVAEDESFASGTSDDWQLIASGVEVAGKTLVSDEFIAGGFGGTYRMGTQQMVREVNAQYALGANQLVFHGLAYEEWPPPIDNSDTATLVRWPGYRAFMTRIPDAFGPRNPTWKLERNLAAYYARTQLVLQTGHRRRDVAVYNHSLSHIQNAFEGHELLERGYSYGYLTPGLLELAQPIAGDGRLYPDGPAYKAVILDRQKTLPLAAAESLLAIASGDVRIVVIGEAPRELPGIDAEEGRATQRLARIVDEVLAQSVVVRDPEAKALSGVLRDLNIEPVAKSSNGTARFIHRSDGDVNYFYVHNPGDDESAGNIRLCAAGVPFHLDAWSGEIARIAEYSVENDCVVLNLTQQPGDADIFALAPPGYLGEALVEPRLPVVSSNAETVYVRGRDLVGRRLDGRAARIALADGTVVEIDAQKLPQPLNLERWQLDVERFLPADPQGRTTETRHELLSLNTVELTHWSEIPGLETVSGIGTYSTDIELGDEWFGLGAYFELSEVSGAFSIRVNGEDIDDLNQIDKRFDLGRKLRPGRNRIEVTVATNLNNVLRSSFPRDYGSQPAQHYGLIGPTILRPYRDTTLPIGESIGYNSSATEPADDAFAEPPATDAASQNLALLR